MSDIIVIRSTTPTTSQIREVPQEQGSVMPKRVIGAMMAWGNASTSTKADREFAVEMGNIAMDLFRRLRPEDITDEVLDAHDYGWTSGLDEAYTVWGDRLVTVKK
jgi:hypothetical protein